MQDKQILIASMNNLIKHISASHKNQEEIFNSLTKKDFEKILSNLDDPLPKLRLTTAHLLGELLYNNFKLKMKFCQLLGIPTVTKGKIVLNRDISKIVEKNPARISHIYYLLRREEERNVQVENKRALLWMINPKNPITMIEHIYKSDLEEAVKNENAADIYIDPLHCMIGFELPTDSGMQRPTDSGMQRPTDSTKSSDDTSYSHGIQIIAQKQPKTHINSSFQYNKSTGFAYIPRDQPMNSSDYNMQGKHQKVNSDSSHIQSFNRHQPNQQSKFTINNSVHIYPPSLCTEPADHRFSLQSHDLKPVQNNSKRIEKVKNNCEAEQMKETNFQQIFQKQSGNTSFQNSNNHSHHAGIQLISQSHPRKSVGGKQNLVKKWEDSLKQTRPPATDRKISGDGTSTPNVKTITLGKGSSNRGCETARERKSLRTYQ